MQVFGPKFFGSSAVLRKRRGCTSVRGSLQCRHHQSRYTLFFWLSITAVSICINCFTSPSPISARHRHGSSSAAGREDLNHPGLGQSRTRGGGRGSGRGEGEGEDDDWVELRRCRIRSFRRELPMEVAFMKPYKKFCPKTHKIWWWSYPYLDRGVDPFWYRCLYCTSKPPVDVGKEKINSQVC